MKEQTTRFMTAEQVAQEMDSQLTQDEINLLSLDLVQKIQAGYVAGKDRKITPENVYQEAVLEGREVLEGFCSKMFLHGSRVEGLEYLDDCLARMERGESILFLPEHRGNLDTPSFYALVKQQSSKYSAILDRLIYVAGRKLNESSDYIKMFTEKYARLVIVPRRDLPPPLPNETESQEKEREANEQEAAQINRAAFRQLVKLRKAGHVFVLFPLGGRLKEDADNVPVKESMSYMQTFDVCYPISMEGNILPPGARMEDERPIQDKVIFRVGRPIESKAFLTEQREIHNTALASAGGKVEEDFEQFAVNRLMRMLEQLRLKGDYNTAFPEALS